MFKLLKRNINLLSLSFSLAFISFFIQKPFLQAHTQDISQVFYDHESNPSYPLKELLKLCGIEQINWDEIIALSQEKLKREDDKEVWQISSRLDLDREKAFFLFDELDLLRPIYASQQHYNYAVIYGATLGTMRLRLQWLLYEWKAGVRFDKIICLGSERPLFGEVEPLEKLLDPKYSPLPFKRDWHLEGPLPSTETELFKMIFSQSLLPKEWEAIPIIFIDTPMKGCMRPHTGDSIIAWLQSGPHPGSCLFVSNQPFIGRQDCVARTFMPKKFTIETIGPGLKAEVYQNEPKATAVLLDQVARWLYQERVIRQNSKVPDAP